MRGILQPVFGTEKDQGGSFVVLPISRVGDPDDHVIETIAVYISG
jgi:hypothetical protein